jgi:hypothetical protein
MSFKPLLMLNIIFSADIRLNYCSYSIYSNSLPTIYAFKVCFRNSYCYSKIKFLFFNSFFAFSISFYFCISRSAYAFCSDYSLSILFSFIKLISSNTLIARLVFFGSLTSDHAKAFNSCFFLTILVFSNDLYYSSVEVYRERPFSI